MDRRATFLTTNLHLVQVTREIIASLAGIQREKRREGGKSLHKHAKTKLVLGSKVFSFFPMCMRSRVAWAGVHCFSFQVMKSAKRLLYQEILKKEWSSLF